MISRVLSVTLFVCLFPRQICPAAAAPNANHPALLFDLDQGFPSGVVENLDLTGLNRIFQVIAKFRNRFDVYAIFSPLSAKSQNLNEVLRQAAERHIPFLLDVYTSDAMTIGNVLIPASPQADPAHALTISLEGLRRLKDDKEIGPYFAGIRIFEVLAADFTVKTCMERSHGSDRVDWCDHFSRNVSTRDVFASTTATSLLDFAKQRGMWVLWSDWKWDAQTALQQKTLRHILDDGNYRDVVVLAYANNLPGESARDNDLNWRNWLNAYSPLVGAKVSGLGLSDQSWTCDVQRECPVNVIKAWAKRALGSGAVALQLEPANYFFELPVAGDAFGYPNDPKWKEKSGRPSASLVLLADTLGVDLRKSEPLPLSTSIPDGATCVSIYADKQKLRPGQHFVLSATFQNSGTRQWSAQRTSVTNLGPASWGVVEARLEVEEVAPGQNATFSLQMTAPAAVGPRRIEVSMKRTDGGAFGQPCAVLVSVE